MGCASLFLTCLSLTLPDTPQYAPTFSLNEPAFDSSGGPSGDYPGHGS